MTPRLTWPLFFAACRSEPSILEIRCAAAEEVLAPDEPSHLGFSAEEAVAWYGDHDVIEATWTGRHSREPASDTFDVTLGPITGEVVAFRHTPEAATATAAECAGQDVVELAREVTVASRDGEVTGAGEARFTLPALTLAHERTAISLEARDLALADPRWVEVDLAVGDDLPPPESVVLYAWRGVALESVEIHADGPSYGVAVWKCDEQHHPGCMTWSAAP